MIWMDLLLGFLEVGLFSFGGAYAAVPLLRDVVLSRGWMGEDMLAYIIAVSESTPGPIMVNLATYVGSTRGGFPGAVIATAAVVLPAFVIILLLMVLLKKLLNHPLFQAVLDALKPCIAGVILATGCLMILKNTVGSLRNLSPDVPAILLTLFLAAGYFLSGKIMKKRIPPIALIAVSAVAGILVYGFV